MRAISVSPVSVKDGKQVVMATILSDDTPETLPTTGALVDGMSADQVFAPFSLLYVVADVENKVYIADESGTFVAQ